MSKKYPLLGDGKWLQQKYCIERLSSCQIGTILGCDKCTVLNALRRSDISVRSRVGGLLVKESRMYPLLDDKEWVHHKYMDERKNSYQIATLVGCASSTVLYKLRQHNIPIRVKTRTTKCVELSSVEWLREKYCIERLSSRQIGVILDCHKSTVLKALKRKDIPLRSRSEAAMVRSPFGSDTLYSREWLHQEYVVDKKSTYDIARIVGCNQVSVFNALHRCGIVPRTYSESKEGSLHPNYGKKLSSKTKEKLRAARRSRRFPTCHTKPELQFEAICTKQDLPFEYTGDGKVWIGKKEDHSINPDFTGKSNGKKFAVFVNGDYWHSQLLRPQLGATQRPEFQISHSKKHRWVPIILWETDLKREDAEAFVLSTLKKEGFDVSNIERQQNAK